MNGAIFDCTGGKRVNQSEAIASDLFMHSKTTLFIFFLFVSSANAKRKKTEPKERKTWLLALSPTIITQKLKYACV